MAEHFTYKPVEWTTQRSKINAPDRLQAIQEVLDKRGPIIAQHWFYYGGRAPDRLVFDDYDEFIEYLNSKAKAGDAFDVWSFADVCTRDNMLAEGKMPDEQGRVPVGGAY